MYDNHNHNINNHNDNGNVNNIHNDNLNHIFMITESYGDRQ